MIPVSRCTTIGPAPSFVACSRSATPGDVADEADVERDRRVPVVVAGERPRAVQAVLLLHRRREPQLAGSASPATASSSASIAARPTRLSMLGPTSSRPTSRIRRREDHRRADVQAEREDRRAVAQAQLDPEVVVADAVLLALLRGEDVAAGGGEEPLDPRAVARERLHRLADVVAALGAVAPVALRAVEQEEALVGDVPDDVADLVHVRLDQHPRPAAADAGDDVADRVAAHLGAARVPSGPAGGRRARSRRRSARAPRTARRGGRSGPCRGPYARLTAA